MTSWRCQEWRLRGSGGSKGEGRTETGLLRTIDLPKKEALSERTKAAVAKVGQGTRGVHRRRQAEVPRKCGGQMGDVKVQWLL